jgi:hypothetical protein
MLKITAAPKWQLTSSRGPLSSKSSVPVTVSNGPMTIRQTFFPRSLDVSFEFKYRRQLRPHLFAVINAAS